MFQHTSWLWNSPAIRQNSLLEQYKDNVEIKWAIIPHLTYNHHSYKSTKNYVKRGTNLSAKALKMIKSRLGWERGFQFKQALHYSLWQITLNNCVKQDASRFSTPN